MTATEMAARLPFGGSAAMAIRRPSLLLTGGYLLLFACTLLTAVIASGQIDLHIRPSSAHGRPIMIINPFDGQPALLLAVEDRQGRRVSYATADYDLIHRVVSQLPDDAISVNDAAARLIRAGVARLWLRTATGAMIRIDRPVAHRPLTAPFWLLIFTGLFGGAVGLWVAVLRPDVPAALALGGSGLGLLFAAYPVGIILNSELFLSGATWLDLMRINYVGIQVFAGSILFVFAVYPARLMPISAALAIMLALLATMIMIALADYDLARRFADHSRLVLVDLAAIVGMALWQWQRSRLDPVGRAYLRLVGATAVLALGGWVATTLGPQLYGGEPLLDVASGALLMVAIYAAIAVGVVRGHMFDVDRWAWTLLASAATLFAIFVAEAALVFVYGLDNGPAASAALLAVGCGWLIARHRLFDRLMGARRSDAAALVGEAHSIVLAASDEERFTRWCAALERVYQPLAMIAADGEANATIAEAGLAMRVPAPRFGHALLLRSAQRGRALFRPADCVIMDRFVALCARIDDDRQAYDRGMLEERQRIAKDLHDDVSGRLLTGLHRDDVDLVRVDVRNALADLRSIVSGLEGQKLPIAAVLADIRQECDERLAAARIALAWDETAGPPMPAVSVEYATYRALHSMMRELTTNVIRHSQASWFRVAVRFDPADGAVAIDARDDGAGLAASVPGHGLHNVAARAGALGGSAVFGSDGGTCVALRVPLERPRSGGVAQAG